jgi:hypothetical protein
MIISFRLFVAAVVLGIFAVSMSGVTAQQQTPTTLRAVRFNGDMTSLLAEMPHAYGVTVGLELDTQGYQRVEMDLSDASITDVMNAIVQSSKKYQWRQTDRFVEIWPLTGSNPLLETRISSFNFKDLSASQAFDQLLNLPEVQANMTTLNLKRRVPDVSPGKVSISRFSLNLEGLTLREALNKIAHESHIEIWIFRNYPNGFFSISSGER